MFSPSVRRLIRHLRKAFVTVGETSSVLGPLPVPAAALILFVVMATVAVGYPLGVTCAAQRAQQAEREAIAAKPLEERIEGCPWSAMDVAGLVTDFEDGWAQRFDDAEDVRSMTSWVTVRCVDGPEILVRPDGVHVTGQYLPPPDNRLELATLGAPSVRRVAAGHELVHLGIYATRGPGEIVGPGLAHPWWTDAHFDLEDSLR